MQTNLKFIKKRTKIQKGGDQAETPKLIRKSEIGPANFIPKVTGPSELWYIIPKVNRIKR